MHQLEMPRGILRQTQRCKQCNDDIEDDYEYCTFHSYLGDDPPRPRREDYCRLCLEPVEEGTEYCTHHNHQRNDEHAAYMQQVEEDFRRHQE